LAVALERFCQDKTLRAVRAGQVAVADLLFRVVLVRRFKEMRAEQVAEAMLLAEVVADLVALEETLVAQLAVLQVMAQMFQVLLAGQHFTKRAAVQGQV
jgi:uncharacterized lipoprotein YmbA